MKTTTVKGLERDLLFQYQKLEMFKSILADLADPKDEELRANLVSEIKRLRVTVKRFAEQYFEIRKIVWAQSEKRRQDECE